MVEKNKKNTILQLYDTLYKYITIFNQIQDVFGDITIFFEHRVYYKM